MNDRPFCSNSSNDDVSTIFFCSLSDLHIFNFSFLLRTLKQQASTVRAPQ